MRLRLLVPLLALPAGLGLAAELSAQKQPVTQPLPTAGVAGQGVALIPINLVVIGSSVPAGTITADRPTLLRRIDSLLADGATSRAPEVKWVPPGELRRIAKRSGGLLPEPDQLGQSVMRGWSMKILPDPLRSNLRRLLAAAGGWRFALIPASLLFKADSAGQLGADLSVLLADTRTGRVVWRSVAIGWGGTPDQVIAKAVATIFPIEGESSP